MPRRKRHSVSCAQLIIPIICIFSGCLQTGPLSSADPSPEDTSVSHPDAGINEEPDHVSIESNDTPDESPESDDSNRNESTPNSPPCEPEASPESDDSTDANNLSPEDEQSEDVPSPDEPASQDDSLPGSEETVNGCANPLSQVLESLNIQLVVTATWASGQSVDGVITNHGSAALDSLLLYAEDPSLIASIWGLIPSGNGYTLPSWNSGLAPGESVSFGMTTSGQELPCFSLAPEAADPAHDEPSSPPTGSGEDPGETTSPVLPDDRKIVAYFVEWGVYQRDYHVADIPADLITHLNYAFADISESGECILYDAYAATDKFYPGDSWEAGSLRGSFNQLAQLKQAHPHLKTLISVGGWTLSSKFPHVASTNQSRAKFAESCVQFMQSYGFDGIDIDWEYPVSGGLVDGTPADRENFTALLAELRTQLDAAAAQTGEAYLLTIAAPAGPSTFANIELDRIHPHLDFINVMTYDFHGGWELETNHHAPLYASNFDPTSHADHLTVDSAITSYLDAGIPAAKVVMGLPFYGRGWQGVPNMNHGLYQSATGPAQAGTWEPGLFDYVDLVDNYMGSYDVRRDPQTEVPWLYSPSTGVMISYDDPESLRRKVTYARERDLGGVMFWELSSDTSDSELLWSIYEPLSEP